MYKCISCGLDIKPGSPFITVAGLDFCGQCASLKTLSELRVDFGVDFQIAPDEIVGSVISVDGVEVSDYVGIDMTEEEVEKFFNSPEPVFNGVTPEPRYPDVTIHTGYFAINNKYPSDYARISIARWTPKDFHGKNYMYLAPTEKILREYKETGDEKKYIHDYFRDVIAANGKNQDDVVCDLLELSNGNKKIILFCFEKEKFCHRHIIGKWLNMAGYRVTEMNPFSQN